MSVNFVDVSTLTVAATSIGLSSADPTSSTAWASGARQAVIVVEGAPVYMRSDGDAATSADVMLNVGDILPILGDSMIQAIDKLRFIRKTSTSATLKIIWYNREAILTERIIRGSVRLVTEAGESITDDTADAIKTLLVDATGTALVKSEDAAHSSGDVGVMTLGVRKNTVGSLSSASGDYTPEQMDDYGNIRVVNDDLPFFGQPEIRCDNEGWGQWERKALQAKYKDSHDLNRHFRYSNWAVHLNGGPQASEESWAAISIPVKDLRVQDLASIAYNWYAQYTGSAHILDIGPNLVFSAYDPTDHSKRVDFNTYGIDNNLLASDGLANRPIEAGIYKYKMTSTDATERVYWYGNNCTGTDTAPAEGADGYWSQYITDALFKNWMIYRIQIQFGYWGATRSTGDVWIMNMRVNDIPVRWEPSEAEKVEIEKRDANMLGKVSLAANNNSVANWERGFTSPLDQKGSTGWLARLYGGVQTGDDWARVNIPINEMHVPDLKTALWSYYMSTAETFGINIVIWVHDPFNHDNRAEITQQATTALLDKAAGWGAHEFNPSTTQFYFYGEGTTNTNLVAGTEYTWEQFVSDELFNTWTIYRITLEYGWQSGSLVFEEAFVADVQINGVQVPLGPADGKHSKSVLTTKTLVGGANSAFDVLSESVDAGTDWDFDFGGTGEIDDAILVIATTGLTAEVSLHLFSVPPTCVLNDNVANTSPVAADVPYFLGAIEFVALRDYGTTGLSYTHVSKSTPGGLPIKHYSGKVYGVLVSVDAMTPGNVLASIILHSTMQD